MDTEKTQWIRMRFKGNKVWVAADASGNPLSDDGKLAIKYRLDQENRYRVHAHSVTPIDSQETGERPSPTGREKAVASNDAEGNRIPPDAIIIYTDGASSGNPGPAGIGVLLQYKGHQKEISRYLGHATNNQAELEAILRGLQEVRNPNLPVRLFTDSRYACGVLERGWKARKNQDLIGDIRGLMKKFNDLKISQIKGHAGEEGNERADYLARCAIDKRKES